MRSVHHTSPIKEAGWDHMLQIRREVTLTPGPVIVRGEMSARNKKKKKYADYVLAWQPGIPVAVVEAKDNCKRVFNQDFEVLRNKSREIKDSNGRTRYYTKELFCGNYFLTSQWFERHWGPFKVWLKKIKISSD